MSKQIQYKHEHEFLKRPSGKIETCRCGAWHHTGDFTPIVEQRAERKPWTVEYLLIGHVFYWCVLEESPYYQQKNLIFKTQIKARAELFAAAPEMYEALKEALLLAQETNHPQSARLRTLFMNALVHAGDGSLKPFVPHS